MPLKGEAKREYQRKWVARRRATWLEDKFCVICGSTTDLEVDHIDPSQKISHRIWSWSVERQAIELAKCQVLCHTHHLEKTKQDVVPEHGDRARYTSTGCRCVLCKNAQASYMREWRNRQTPLT